MWCASIDSALVLVAVSCFSLIFSQFKVSSLFVGGVTLKKGMQEALLHRGRGGNSVLATCAEVLREVAVNDAWLNHFSLLLKCVCRA